MTFMFSSERTPNNDGELNKTAFGLGNGRTSFGGSSIDKSFYSDGRKVKFAITETSD